MHSHPASDQQSFRYYRDLYIKTATLAYSTRLGYSASLSIYWQPHLDPLNMMEVRYSDLLIIDQKINWPSQKTRKNALAPLRGVFALAYMDNRLPEHLSPAHQLKLGKHQRPRPDPFDKQERAAILNWMLDHKQGLYFRTAFATGMRSGELIALTWQSYDGESFRVFASRVRGKLKDTKTSAERKVYLPGWLCKELNEYRTRPLNGAIFLNQYQRPYQKPDKLNQVFRRCLSELNIRERNGPYPWRHTYASIGISEGAEPGFLARQLGHSLETFYRTYADWISKDSDQAQRDIVERSWK